MPNQQLPFTSDDAFLPYGRQCISEADIATVAKILRSDWLTTGPMVDQFEKAFASYSGSKEAVAVSSGTAALHCMIDSLGIGPGDEVIIPSITFAASANCVVYQGAKPVFVDVEPDTLLIDPAAVQAAISHRTRAIVAVDYAGQPCHYNQLQAIADRNGIALISDACHSLGGAYQGRPVGKLALMTAFSFHPVKPITTGEGGMVTTNDSQLARRMRSFRNHGITTDHRARTANGTWAYSMEFLGYNYRLTDLQCALGISQLERVDEWTLRRRKLAQFYDQSLAADNVAEPLKVRLDRTHAYHLYVVRVNGARESRDKVFARMRQKRIGVNVHYLPVHLHPFYQSKFGTVRGQCPVAERAYDELLTLPMFSELTKLQVSRVIRALHSSKSMAA